SDITELGKKGTGTLVSQADVDALHSRVTITSCELCHKYDASTQANTENLPLQSTVDTAMANGKLGTADATCIVCHDYNITEHGNIDHVAELKVTGISKCTSCHDKDNIGDNDTYMAIHNQSGNGCGTCHTNPDGGGELISPWEINSPAGGDCATCHPFYDTDFATGHQFENHDVISGLVSCQSCHTGGIMTHIHGDTFSADCQKCHAASNDGTLITGINGWGNARNHYIGTPVNCGGCHQPHVANFATGHLREDHGGLSDHPECTTCHTGNIIVSTLIHNNDCAHCHTNIIDDGSLTAGVNGYGTALLPAPNTCKTCHATYFDAHIHGTAGGSAEHSIAVTATDLAQEEPGIQCDFCHQSPITDLLASMEDIKDLHNVPTNGPGSCATCHLASRDINVDAPTGTTIDQVVQLGGQIDCLACHLDKKTPVIHYIDHALYVAQTASCTTADCHTESSLVTGLHDVKKCYTCHTTSHVPITLISNAAGNTVPVPNASNECITCHSVGSPVPLNDHNNATLAAPQHNMLSIDANCAINCHSHPGSTFAEIYASHQSSCLVCHGSGVQKVRNAIEAGRTRGGETSITCQTCHPTTGSTQHEFGHNTLSNATFILRDCSGCHITNTFTDIVIAHKNDCNQCHSYTVDKPCDVVDDEGCAYEGTFASEVQDAIVNGMAGNPVNCESCHHYNLIYKPISHTTEKPPHMDLVNIPPLVTFEDPAPDCSICHVQPWGGHMDNMETHVLCSPCHYSVDPGATGVIHVMGDGSSDTCKKCHTSERPEVLASIANGIAGMIQDCTNCHGLEDTLYHPTPPDNGYNDTHDMISTTGSCTTCHFPAANMIDTYAIHANDCVPCHSINARQEALDAVAAGVSTNITPPPAPVECATCHTVKVPDHSLDLNNEH
nr:hypothetical protein [Desulfobulbaceae bacterium]